MPEVPLYCNEFMDFPQCLFELQSMLVDCENARRASDREVDEYHLFVAM